MAGKQKRGSGGAKGGGGQRGLLVERVMPRHVPFYAGLILGAVTFAFSLWLAPIFAIGLGSNALFIGFLALTYLKLPHLSADFLKTHAREEDTPVGGIFLIVLIVVIASVVSLFLALSGAGNPDLWEVTIGVMSVLLGWFTVQAMAALHYAYEYYEASEANDDEGVVGGLGFPGREEPDGYDFMYFAYAIGTSVATSDTTVESHEMRRLVTVHMIFSHLFNTIILASAVNVLLSLGGA